MEAIIITLVIGFVLFELIEHVVFPLVWFIKDRKRRSVCGETGMLEKVGEVRYWEESTGRVFVNGELWRAVSEFPLSAGDRVVVQQVDRLTLTVIPVKRLTWHSDSIKG